MPGPGGGYCSSQPSSRSDGHCPGSHRWRRHCARPGPVTASTDTHWQPDSECRAAAPAAGPGRLRLGLRVRVSRRVHGRGASGSLTRSYGDSRATDCRSPTVTVTGSARPEWDSEAAACDDGRCAIMISGRSVSELQVTTPKRRG